MRRWGLKHRPLLDMMIAVNVSIADISNFGKEYQWPRTNCPKCLGKTWGHGFRLRYYSEFSDGIYIKRCRCPTCKIVISLVPSGYWPCYRSSISTVYQTLKHKLQSLHWPAEFSRQRGGHWLRKFIARFKMVVGISSTSDPMDFLDKEYVKSNNFLTGRVCKSFHIY